MSRKCYVIGVFPPPYGGATVKCKLFCEALIRQDYEVTPIDMLEAKRNVLKLFRLLFRCIKIFKTGNPIVYCLDTKRLIVILNLQRLFRKSFQKTTVIAVGGGFQNFVSQHPSLMSNLRQVKSIWAETKKMQEMMINLGLSQTVVFPNPKSEEGACSPIINDEKTMLKVVYFSQISTQKGVEDIIEAVKLLQNRNAEYIMDFYGHVMPEISEMFKSFVADHPNIKYCGVFDSTKKSVYKKLNQYDVLLFPTHWPTEGVPGILVEAKMAGVAIIASDHNYNSEVVDENKGEGILLRDNYALEMANSIEKLYRDREYLNSIKMSSYSSRKRFSLEEYYSLINTI